MKFSPRKETLSISAVLIGMVWCIGLYIWASNSDPVRKYGGSLSAIAINLLIAVLYLMIFRKKPDVQTTEVKALSSCLTISFLLISGVINTVLVGLKLGGFNRILVFVNIAAVVLFFVLAIYVEKESSRVEQVVASTAEKISASAECSRIIAELVSGAEEPAVRQKLLSLKEIVDYSSNVSGTTTVQLEQEFREQLYEIRELMFAHSDEAQTMEKISAAEKIWKQRCAILH